jgi:hypothetical protein
MVPVFPLNFCASTFDRPKDQKCTWNPSVSEVSGPSVSNDRSNAYDFVNDPGCSGISKARIFET